MGKRAEDFDAQIGQLRMSYLFAIGRHDWDLGMHIGNLMNKAVSQKNRVTYNDGHDIETYPDTLIIDIYDRMNSESHYKKWCMKYMPLIENAISRERDHLLAVYGE